MANELCGQFITRLFHSRTDAHLQHLATRSYAKHKALEAYYEGIVPLADSFAEAYQGIYGLETEYPSEYERQADPLAMLTGLRTWIDKNRKAITPQSNLQNIIDEVVTLIDGTIYKLRFLA